jgi:hypothetical protein
MIGHFFFSLLSFSFSFTQFETKGTERAEKKNRFDTIERERGIETRIRHKS